MLCTKIGQRAQQGCFATGEFFFLWRRHFGCCNDSWCPCALVACRSLYYPLPKRPRSTPCVSWSWLRFFSGPQQESKGEKMRSFVPLVQAAVAVQAGLNRLYHSLLQTVLVPANTLAQTTVLCAIDPRSCSYNSALPLRNLTRTHCSNLLFSLVLSSNLPTRSCTRFMI